MIGDNESDCSRGRSYEGESNREDEGYELEEGGASTIFSLVFALTFLSLITTLKFIAKHLIDLTLIPGRLPQIFCIMIF
ncbi:hypothetical protein PVK06_027625 [Gossypium arboreum]|uniref:Uncharacterized protein n=1 Tax=Gossypium arboreum TaxID=29729 RepID=A0ABR0P0R6_GOSAR|nr:hypothetical protein PVK06_027625 [Gossypium arboreum]